MEQMQKEVLLNSRRLHVWGNQNPLHSNRKLEVLTDHV